VAHADILEIKINGLGEENMLRFFFLPLSFSVFIFGRKNELNYQLHGSMS
jgi:hypothetical protein